MTKTLRFGHGNLYVSKVEQEGKTFGIVICEPEEHRKVGAYWPEVEGKSIDDFNPQVIMEFDNIESIDVVIDVLEQAKHAMLQESGTTRQEQACHICGCTDSNACVTFGDPCYWIEPDLCSACRHREE